MTTMGRGHEGISPGEADALARDAADPASALRGPDRPWPSARP
jgi:hypothetical protein